MTLPAYANHVATFPELYEQYLVGPLFSPWVPDLLDRLQLAPGDRVLDIACGTGIVARLARERVGAGARVVAVDLSPQMLAVGRRVEPGIDWREGSAVALPVPAGEAFDAIVCQQGLQFFPDRPAAAREMRRVAAPGGRVAISVWRSLDEAPFFRETHAIAERHLGPIVDQRHAFGDAAGIERLLVEAGFRDVRVEPVRRTIRFGDPAPFLHLNTMALVGMSPASKTMSDELRNQTVATIASESASLVPRFSDGEGLAFDLATNIATARA